MRLLRELRLLEAALARMQRKGRRLDGSPAVELALMAVEHLRLAFPTHAGTVARELPLLEKLAKRAAAAAATS